MDTASMPSSASWAGVTDNRYAFKWANCSASEEFSSDSSLLLKTQTECELQPILCSLQGDWSPYNRTTPKLQGATKAASQPIMPYLLEQTKLYCLPAASPMLHLNGPSPSRHIKPPHTGLRYRSTSNSLYKWNVLLCVSVWLHLTTQSTAFIQNRALRYAVRCNI